ncbi:hypothetical protein HWV62_19189 [Athelia sp. TMB]|nr:hypothetical protein HWV62_19189 [Athelia sp. TMB]
MATASSWSPHPKVQIDKLSLDENQHKLISTTYRLKHEVSLIFDDHPTSQSDAMRLMQHHGLNRKAREALENRWNVQWTAGWKSGMPGDYKRRTLLQCASGFNSEARFLLNKRNLAGRGSSVQSDRRNPYDFTGCLAHAEITERESDGAVTRIVGILEHMEACARASIVRLPPVPLHPHVYEVALEQLRSGGGIPAVQSKNLAMLAARSYRGMGDKIPLNVRYHFLTSDIRQLYRLFTKSYGVDISSSPAHNLHQWLDHSSPLFRPELLEAIFYYTARTQKDERLKVCISTRDMDDAAWRFAHNSQLILDGTFGVCSSRLLLFIAMAIDDDGKGTPIAFFFFSAPTGNKATHAGYNRDIIRELLRKWRDHLSIGRPCTFRPLVAITDTDTKERGGLQDAWEEIWLLLCHFHVSCCWANKRKKLFAGDDFWIQYAARHMHELDIQLFATTEHAVALRLVSDERAHAHAIFRASSAAKSALEATIEYLDYLTSTWLPVALWQSWSQFGRIVASAILKIPVAGVLPTTNHLESFNRLLKRKYIPLWQRAGSRLRFDFLISILITHVLPEIFANRRAQHEYHKWLIERFSTHSNSADILAAVKLRQHPIRDGAQLCWWRDDQQRDGEAQNLLARSCLFNITTRKDDDGYEASCRSSSRVGVVYQLQLLRDGYASCDCPDFIHRGGACKHLRALRLTVNHWISGGLSRPFYYPTSLSSATRVAPPLSQHAPPLSDAQFHPRTTNTGALAVDNLLALQKFASQSGGHEEHEDVEDDMLDTMCDAQSDCSDSFSEYSPIGAEIVKLARNACDDDRDAVGIQVQQRAEHIANIVLPHLHGLISHTMDATLLRTDCIEELEHTLSELQLALRESLSPRHIPSTPSLQPPSRTSNGQPSMPLPPVVRSDKHSLPLNLMPPSPEARQMRKFSGSVL